MNPRGRPSPPYNPAIRDIVIGKRQWSSALALDDKKRGFIGWHERGYLPHRDEPGLVQFVTFRQVDAFPAELKGEWSAMIQIENDRERRLQLERYLDLGKGECHLRSPQIAAMIERCLLYRHEQSYDLRAWVIMPNHVHLLFRAQKIPMSRLIKAWKGFTAKEANKILGRSGQFWQDDYWDVYMRNEGHELRARRYIENNPVKANLTPIAKQWQWGSARYRMNIID
jgi:putative transposase